MNVRTLLQETIGWMEDVTVEQVYFEVVDVNGLRDVEVFSLDEEIVPDYGISYFYALNEDGFYWGNLEFGHYNHYGYREGLWHLIEFEEMDEEFMISNPEKVGEILTDNIIADKDMFESFFLLTSFYQIYNSFPLISQLRDYLTEFYQSYIPAEFEVEEEECVS